MSSTNLGMLHRFWRDEAGYTHGLYIHPGRNIWWASKSHTDGQTIDTYTATRYCGAQFMRDAADSVLTESSDMQSLSGVLLEVK